jgi:hypothetical protein
MIYSYPLDRKASHSRSGDVGATGPVVATAQLLRSTKNERMAAPVALTSFASGAWVQRDGRKTRNEKIGSRFRRMVR